MNGKLLVLLGVILVVSSKHLQYHYMDEDSYLPQHSQFDDEEPAHEYYDDEDYGH